MKRLIRKILYWSMPEIGVLRDKNYDFSLLMKQKDYVDETKHVILYAPYFVDEVSIGKYTYVSRNSHISKTTIGSFCSVGPNLVCGWGIHPTEGISTSPMFYSVRKQNGVSLCDLDKIEERAQIVIGNDVFIGANVTILDGVTIGDGAVIGAGAVVSKDIPPYAIAVGCPIKVIKYRFDNNQVEALKRIEWWNFEDERLKEIEECFFDVNKFIQIE